jgi:hypothetical protein
MRVPSHKALLEAFHDLTPDDAKLIRALAKAVDEDIPGHFADPLRDLIEDYAPDTAKYVRGLYSDPYRTHLWRVTVALHAMDEVMGTSGVETLGPDIVGAWNLQPAPPYEYLNAGDPYATTLIYRRRDNSLHIGDWGSIAEKHSNW